MWFPGLLPRVACPLAVPWGGTECYAGSSWWRTPVHLIVARKQRKRQEGTGTLVSLSWVHSWSPNILLVDPPLNEIIPSSGNITGLGHSRSTLEQRRCINMTKCTACQGSAHIPSWHSEGWDWETVSPPWLNYFRKKILQTLQKIPLAFLEECGFRFSAEYSQMCCWEYEREVTGLQGWGGALARWEECKAGVEKRSIASQCRQSTVNELPICLWERVMNGNRLWASVQRGKGLGGWCQLRTKIITNKGWEAIGVTFLSSLNWNEDNFLTSL